ncbi:MAG: hypothetical protein JJE04_10025 [Acidobacteriia bacterium]|nr:hypothetical protein [Terriglobia bacterium]
MRLHTSKRRESHPVTIVGGESLLGAELRELLVDSIPGVSIHLAGSEDESTAILTERGGEPVVITPMDAGSLPGAKVIFLAGSAEGARKAITVLKNAAVRPPIIDLSYAWEEAAEARLRAPLAGSAEPHHLMVVAHPAATVLACFLRRLHSAGPVLRSVAQVFEPVSERGRMGVNELQQQTLSLLSFKKPEKVIFDAQLSFNMLLRYGSEAPYPLEAVEQRIEKHLAALLAGPDGIPMPSLRLIQAPIMHGHCFSVWVEMETLPALEQLHALFSSDPFDLRGPGLDPPDVAGIAGHNGIAIGGIEPDRNHPRAAWFWMVADNLRISAVNAVQLAKPLLGVAR